MTSVAYICLLAPAAGDWWRFKYRYGGKEKLLSLGTYPDVSLAKARDAREKRAGNWPQGIDPSAARQAGEAREGRRPRPTISRWWRASGWRTSESGRPSITRDTLKRFEAFVFPAIGRRPITSVAAPELLPLVRKIEARGTLVTAHKVGGACGQVFAYAIASGRCERNPAADLRGALKSSAKAQTYGCDFFFFFFF